MKIVLVHFVANSSRRGLSKLFNIFIINGTRLFASMLLIKYKEHGG